MKMEITETSDGLVAVALAGRLDSPGVESFELKLTAQTVPRGARALVDLTGVEFVGSLAIRMFITLARTLANVMASWCCIRLNRPCVNCSRPCRCTRSFPCTPTRRRQRPPPRPVERREGNDTDRRGAPRFSASFPGTLAAFEAAFAQLRRALDEEPLDAEARFNVELVFEEIVANIVRYAMPMAARRTSILRCTSEAVRPF